MLIYLDTMIVVYCVEGPPSFQARALARIAAGRAAGDGWAVSELSRLECCVMPVRNGNAALLADFDAFFSTADVTMVPLTTAVYRRATIIRAVHHFALADSLHLAAAVEAGCSAFLTNDVQLSSFPDIPVEVLP